MKVLSITEQWRTVQTTDVTISDAVWNLLMLKHGGSTKAAERELIEWSRNGDWSSEFTPNEEETFESGSGDVRLVDSANLHRSAYQENQCDAAFVDADWFTDEDSTTDDSDFYTLYLGMVQGSGQQVVDMLGPVDKLHRLYCSLSDEQKSDMQDRNSYNCVMAFLHYKKDQK